MRTGNGTVTSSRFKPRLPGKQHALAFKVAFDGSDATAARFLGASLTSIWRWRHDRSPLPRWAAEILAQRLREKRGDLIAAELHMRLFLERPPLLPRKLSGCCAGLKRRV